MKKTPTSRLPASLQGLDGSMPDGDPMQYDPMQYAQGMFERAREGADPTMLMNPQWAKYLDALNEHAPGGFASVKGSAPLSGLATDQDMAGDMFQTEYGGGDEGISQSAINQRAARFGLKNKGGY